MEEEQLKFISSVALGKFDELSEELSIEAIDVLETLADNGITSFFISIPHIFFFWLMKVAYHQTQIDKNSRK
jgi:hypothetical protein